MDRHCVLGFLVGWVLLEQYTFWKVFKLDPERGQVQP